MADGRAASVASEAVRTGGQCAGEATFRQYDGPAGAQQPQPQPQPQPPPAEEGRPGEPAGRAEEEEPQPPQQQERAGMPAEPPAGLPAEPAAERQSPQVPPPPAEPPADDRPGEQEAGQDGGQQAAVQPPPTAAEDGAAEDEGGCLVATAAHGTELAPQVQFLREVRDNTLLTTESGRAFMSVFGAAYYSFSPQVADLEREHPAFRQAAAALLAPMLYALSVVGAAEPGPEHGVAAYGAQAIAMVAGMYVAAPAAGAWYTARLGRGLARVRRGGGGGGGGAQAA